MKTRYPLVSLVLLMSMFFNSGCSVLSVFKPTETPTQTPLPTQTSTPTITPTATEVPFFVDSIVWAGEIQVPILVYHQFYGDYQEKSTGTKMRYSDFKAQLQSLYDNGYSLISLKSWMDGTFTLPVGRKPLIITMDDFWIANQLFLEDDGTPSIHSGVGIIWAFSKEHPDFGFSVSAFACLGDKKTADKYNGTVAEDYFILSDENSNAWMDKLGRTMVWAIENGVDPYNHLYTHPKLSATDNAGIVFELKENDRVARYYLTKVGREDLIPQLGNMIALPYGEWPATQRGIDILKEYKNSEGEQVQAIFEAYNIEYNEQELTPSIFSDGFDPYKLPRIMANISSVDWVIEQKEAVPTAAVCKLGPLDETQAANLDVIQTAIQNAISTQTCPEGIYNVNGNVFVAKGGTVTLYKNNQIETDLGLSTSTPTLAP